MYQKFCTLLGNVIEAEALQIEAAKEIVKSLQEGRRWFSLVECRRLIADDETAGQSEIVVFDVEPEIPTHCVHHICDTERIAAVFYRGLLPDTLALRIDFPLVPHLNARNEEFPRSLCLWEEPSEELRLRWTAATYLERIREWLRLTARGELHAPDQPLEPLLPASRWRFVAPESLLCGEADTVRDFTIHRMEQGGNHVLFARCRPMPQDEQDNTANASYAAIVIQGEPQTHGIIRHLPLNLKQLHDFMCTAQIDLLGELRSRLRSLQEENVLLQKHLVIVLVLPKTRLEGGAPETFERHAFVVTKPLLQIGEAIGIWAVSNGFSGILLLPDETQQGESVELLPMNVTPMLSRRTGSLFNGLDSDNEVRISAVGAGALGSQVFSNLARAGFGQWTVIDKDVYLPHNGARHALFGDAIGYPKAWAIVQSVNTLHDETFQARSIVADVLSPAEKREEVESALKTADVVIDFSASVPIARYLSHDLVTSARGISVFLNPRGSDLVILAEDKDRNITLADLEMQLYRLIITESDWRDHLQSTGEKIRYARSCGDLSGRISQESVATHSATASRALRRTIATQEASINLWRLDSESDQQVRHCIVPDSVVETKCGEWTVRTDRGLLRKIHSMRAERLPAETGGVLVGSFDTHRKVVYIVDALPAPLDSEERVDSFVRGCAGLKEKVEKIQHLTANQVLYAGEWHSHPIEHDCKPSRKDFKLFESLAEHRQGDGLPPLMLIAGANNECSWFVETMPEPSKKIVILYIVRTDEDGV